MQINKLKKKLIKKIITSLFIANLALIITNSFCMMTVFTRSMSQSSNSMHHIQRRGFGSVPILSRERYNTLLKKTEEDRERLLRLQHNYYSNPKDIDILQRRIDRNRRFLMTCQISNQVDLSDDAAQ
jgi:hypothetical protein